MVNEKLERIRNFANLEKFYILENDQPTRTDFYSWAKFRSDGSDAIAKSYIDDIFISTVFLGIEHGHDDDGLPMLFETMVFAPGRKFDELCARFSGKEEAVKFHQITYEALQSLWVGESFNILIYLAIPFLVLLGILAA